MPMIVFARRARLLALISVLLPSPALQAASVEVLKPVCPVFLREPFNPVLGLKVVVEGDSAELTGLEFDFAGTGRPEDLAGYELRVGPANPAAAAAAKEVLAAGATPGEGKIAVKCARPLTRGEHWLWLSVTLREEASWDSVVAARLQGVTLKGESLTFAEPLPVSGAAQRIGQSVRLPGDDGVRAYRIPGLVRSAAGSLIAVYDVRRRSAVDLPGDIDVGVSRSTDGGRHWEPMRVALDMGSDPQWQYDGVGDPAILLDPQTGRLWLAALWSHGKRAWHGSGPGLTPEETGQLVLACSDDDGRSWSAPRNITPQVKDPAWRLLLGGPGAGIALRDGTLLFAAQYRAADGKPWSTLIRSRDHGETWQIGRGVKESTTEAQLAELADGSVMINCRDDRGGARTIAVTRDLGESWQLHATDRQALREPVCMASLLAWETPQRGLELWFSNPDDVTARRNMTLKRSTDEGLTWPADAQQLYDSRECYGYSCLAPIDNDHLGILYESAGGLRFLRWAVKGK